MRVIGMDFGNYYVYMSCMLDMDPETRLGGTAKELLPTVTGAQDGIPSIYRLSSEGDPEVGLAALQKRFSPRAVDLLKRKMGKTIPVDLGKGRMVNISADEAITEVATACVRIANQVLNDDQFESSNLVALAYPANFDPHRVERFVKLIEAATLEDGTHIEVVGTIAEPAAAALDYLSSDETLRTKEKVTALVMDLGAGTFDAALLSAYPSGKADASNRLKYYDLIDCCGINIGGNEFTQALCDHACDRVGLEEGERCGWKRNPLLVNAEATKIALSTASKCEFEFFDYEQGKGKAIVLSREEFEECTHTLLAQIVTTTKSLVNRNKDVEVDIIVVTGGGGNMPMVKEAAAAIIPGVPARSFRPAKAISYGAAKYYTEGYREAVIKHTDLAIGIMSYINSTDDRQRIRVGIPRGSELPYKQESPLKSTTRDDKQRNSVFPVMRALSESSDCENPNEWEMIGRLVYQHAEPVPQGTLLTSRLSIDERGFLHIECNAPNRPQDGLQEEKFFWDNNAIVDSKG